MRLLIADSGLRRRDERRERLAEAKQAPALRSRGRNSSSMMLLVGAAGTNSRACPQAFPRAASGPVGHAPPSADAQGCPGDFGDAPRFGLRPRRFGRAPLRRSKGCSQPPAGWKHARPRPFRNPNLFLPKVPTVPSTSGVSGRSEAK